MAHQHALGAHLHVISHDATAPAARLPGPANKTHLILICHGAFITDVGAGVLTSGQVATPGPLAIRFAVAHGSQADEDDLQYCLKEASKHGVDHVERLWPDAHAAPMITDYALGKGAPEPAGGVVPAWFRSDDARNGGSWTGPAYLNGLIAKLSPAQPFDLARIRKSCHTFADVLVSLTAAHQYTHLLCHFCREEITV